MDSTITMAYLTSAIFCSAIKVFPERSKAVMYVAMVPRFSSDLSATMTESLEPGRNLNEENPWTLLRGCGERKRRNQWKN